MRCGNQFIFSPFHFKRDWLKGAFSLPSFQTIRGTFGTYSIIREIQRTEDKGATSNIGRVGRARQQGHGDPWRRHPQFRRAWRLFPIFTRCWGVAYTNSRIFTGTFLGELSIFAINSDMHAYWPEKIISHSDKLFNNSWRIICAQNFLRMNSAANSSKSKLFASESEVRTLFGFFLERFVEMHSVEVAKEKYFCKILLNVASFRFTTIHCLRSGCQVNASCVLQNCMSFKTAPSSFN